MRLRMSGLCVGVGLRLKPQSAWVSCVGGFAEGASGLSDLGLGGQHGYSDEDGAASCAESGRKVAGCGGKMNPANVIGFTIQGT